MTRIQTAAEFRTSTAFAAIRLAALGWAVAIFPIGALLLVVADTWMGRCFASGSMIIALLPLTTTVAYLKTSRIAWRASVAGTGFVVVLALVVLSRAPSGTPSDPRLANVFPEPDERYSRLALSNLLPEEDQLLAGFTIAPALDPLLTMHQAAELRQLTRTVYRELETDDAFHQIGSAMRFTYQEMVTSAAGPRHCYTYIPASLDRHRPARLLVFFHGSGGNFKGYLWVLAKVADQAGLVVVAPSGGIGRWSPSESVAQLDFAIKAAQQVTAIDPQHVTLMGLSNGGLAVSHLLQKRDSRIESLIFVSPVFDLSAVPPSVVADGSQKTRALVVSGAEDDRIPPGYVRQNTAILSATGAHIEQRFYPGADHFLIFSHRDALIRDLVAWFAARE